MPLQDPPVILVRALLCLCSSSSTLPDFFCHGANPRTHLSTSGNVCREFATLVEANAVAQLPESDFEVDPGLRDIIEAQIKQEEEAVCQVLLHIVWRPSKTSRVAVQLHHRQLKHLRPITSRSDIVSCQPACIHMGLGTKVAKFCCHGRFPGCCCGPVVTATTASCLMLLAQVQISVNEKKNPAIARLCNKACLSQSSYRLAVH